MQQKQPHEWPNRLCNTHQGGDLEVSQGRFANSFKVWPCCNALVTAQAQRLFTAGNSWHMPQRWTGETQVSCCPALLVHSPFLSLLSIIRVACSCFLAISHTSKCFRIKELIWAYWRKTNFYTPRNPQSKWCRIEIVHFQWFYEKHASTNTYIWLLYITLQSRPTGSSKSK